MNRLVAVIVSALCLGACSGQKAPAAPAQAAQAPAAPAQAAPPPAKAPPAIEDPTFKLAFVSAKPRFTAAEAGALSLVLTPLGGYHVNQEYPFKIELSAPDAFGLERTQYSKAEADEFADERASFSIPFTARSGEHEVRAKVSFAVCTAETCVPDTRTVALAVNVR